MPKHKAGLNGIEHSEDEIKHYGPLQSNGHYLSLPSTVEYLGDGRWIVPLGATIKHRAGEDWLLTMPDGLVFHVWAEG